MGICMSSTYPTLTLQQLTEINTRLAEIVSLCHAGSLTKAQLTELCAAVELQTGHAEALHRFPLRNADEPAFIRSPPARAHTGSSGA